MDCRRNRANHFARRLFAMHTRDRLIEDLGLVKVAGIVTVHPDPMHEASFGHLLFSNHRDIVLGLAGDGTGVTSDADVQIDNHAPLVAFVDPVIVVVDVVFAVERLLFQVGEIRMFLELR